MPTDAVINDLIDTNIMPGLDPGYTTGEQPDFGTWKNLDPFGLISTVPDSPLSDYDFGNLGQDQGQAFFEKINMARKHEDPHRDMPDVGELAPDQLAPKPLSNGIAPLQHSIWVGNPLNETVPKQKAFMDSLAKNKRDNPDWTVVLWTDQSRDALNNAPDDSTLGKMRQWAAENNVVLASIDEVYGGNNKMSAHHICKLEQNKSGSGRAAASDIVRLEVLKRFGGMYVDGDKAIQVPLDKITEAAEKNVMRVIVPQAKVGTNTVLEPETDAEREAVLNGMRVIEVRGFAAGNENNRYQNCAMMAPKGSPAVETILDRIQDNYKQDRHQLKNNGFSVDEGDRASRVEVITRTGPSVMRDTVDPQRRGKALMPLGSVNTYTGTTSWTGEKVFTGETDPTTLAGRIGDLPTPHALHHRAGVAATQPPRLPQVDAISDESRTKIANAVKKSVTALSYTIPNEMGRLDMNHIKPHLANLTPQEQQLAIHATLQTLARDEFNGVNGLVTTLRLPKDLPVSRETLDFLRDGNLANLELDKFTVQEAALEGNMQFLRYAKDNGMLDDLSVQTSQRLDGGSSQGGPQGGSLDVVEAAIIGGNRDAIQYLSSLPSFRTYPKIDDAVKKAAGFGQVDTVIALAEAHNKPEAIHQLLDGENIPGRMGVEVLERFKGTFGDLDTFKQASGPLLTKAVFDNATDTIPRMQELGVEMDHLDADQRKKLVSAMNMRSTDAPKSTNMLVTAENLGVDTELLCAAAKQQNDFLTTAYLDKNAVDGPACDEILRKAALVGGEDDVLITAARLERPDLITASLNKNRPDDDKIAFGTYDPEAQLAIAHAKVPNSEVGKNDYKNVDVSTLTPQQARELVQKAMVYSHDRLRADATGDKGRVQGWNELLESMKTEPNLSGDANLQSLIGQTQGQLSGMNSKTVSVRDEMRQKAKAVDSPDLSQRVATSTGGKIREFFKASPAPHKSPDDHQFVPSKGMVKK
ncbi:glycosyl transferase-like sugar-binding protein [Roseimicrobium gellanilyticum]|uniref:Glycosyl transferase-like sugar-binding protein n=1 Tax=Roseimicrobium gellanilyticum TaxID=748857 RepID=A0A366HMP3_9BACT|nr:TcdA/TcdB catalytic glycosyltransferase domain-containing protein [Roseimicrobium gellanilyticum]RBP44419.1 glycosyl transferase-like sugar-binding protein [Roseimicrobium gellanilyticum]